MRRPTNVALLASMMIAVSCSTPEPPPPPTPRPAETTAPPPSPPPPIAPPPRPEPVRLQIPPAFQEAVAKGTRTLDGVPGPRYWQQRLEYRIDAALNPKTALLEGEETVKYVNRSPDTLTTVVVHLYQNLFKAGSARTEPVPTTGGMTIERVAVAGREIREQSASTQTQQAGASYRIDGTLMTIRLARPLAPGDSTNLLFAWHFTVPPAPAAPRTKHVGSQLYLMAQWYPQIAVYDDINGWHAGQYLATGEFYLEYGDFDVALTLPEGYLVASTGVLQNADEVLTPNVQARLRQAATSSTVVRVVTQDHVAAKSATERVPGGELTWRFRARNVRDFAFAASNRYLWDATSAKTPDANGDGKPETVVVNAFYRPEATAWREAARYSKHSVEFHAENWHPYIYPQITSAEGPEGGMEYPMIVFVDAFDEPAQLYEVITHEIAHQWFPMMVGSNERLFAWQDEGITTYAEQLALRDMFPQHVLFTADQKRYLGLAGKKEEAPMMRDADLYPSVEAYVVASYSKPGLALHALEKVIGKEKLRDALREYARRWLLKHPAPIDFFRTVSSVAVRDLDWFWQSWWFTTGVVDQAIAAVETNTEGTGERVVVRVENAGQLPMPVELMLTLTGGQTQRVTVPADVWAAGSNTHAETITVPARLERVVIDPDSVLPDVRRDNNVWVRTP
jgi:hypothetical protein